ncbi:mitochondrial glutathione transporter SLC25A40-like [Artemia franciscana]|uniref:Solute carrier family 25 member 40 n=1 Tax=Artemia franciscana TaxID=6661 RepID=A0AA88HPT3_ARTSF|nr:hypothetical protein QYM36_009316 [Artemia franciscana]
MVIQKIKLKEISMEPEVNMDNPLFRVTPAQQMLSSCTGALLTSCFVTPLDVIKIRLQAQQKALMSNKCFIYCNGLMDHLCPCLNGNGSSTTQQWYKRPAQFTGTIDAFVKITRNEGVLSLWSGLSPTLVLALPATVIYFTTYEQLRVHLNDKYGSYRSQPMWIPLLAGGLARTWAVTLVSPLELIRTKMQSQRLSYLDVRIAVKDLVKVQGVKGLWLGLGPSLLRDVPFSAIYWLGYESLKKKYMPDPNRLGLSFLCGALAGSFAAVVTLPFDVVKTHRQIELGEQVLISGKTVRSSTLAAIMKIYQQSGVSGLFTGVVPRVIKVAPACAVMISSYEYGKLFFCRYNARTHERTLSRKFEEV